VPQSLLLKCIGCNAQLQRQEFLSTQSLYTEANQSRHLVPRVEVVSQDRHIFSSQRHSVIVPFLTHYYGEKSRSSWLLFLFGLPFLFPWLFSALTGYFGNNFQQNSDALLHFANGFPLYYFVWYIVTCIKEKHSNPFFLPLIPSIPSLPIPTHSLSNNHG
jgi:hypothetical protein